MLNSEDIYAIVKDHRDVWGPVLNYDSDSRWVDTEDAHEYLQPETAEVALLGLGLRWLASGGGTGHSYISGMVIGTNGTADIDVWATSSGDINRRRTNPLAAVYAAIDAVKQSSAR